MIFAGIGSYVSGRAGYRFARFGTILIPILLLAYFFVLTPVLDHLQFWSTSLRVCCAFLLLFPITFLMGIPFPLVLSHMKTRYGSEYASLMYGWNGIASVIAVILSLLFSLHYGFQNLFVAGIALYVVVVLLSGFLIRK
jgi:hypothetical protein